MNKSRKRITINFIANIVSYAVSLGISFVLTPFLISQIGKETYSFYPIANTFLNYLVIMTNSLCSVATRFIAINFSKKNEKEAKTYFNAAMLVESLIGMVTIIPSALLIVFVDRVLNVPVDSVNAVRMLFAFVFSSGSVNIVSNILGVATFATNRIDLRSYRELGAALLKAGLCVCAYSFFPASIVYIGIIALIVAVFNFLMQFIYTKKLLPGFLPNREKPAKRHFKELLAASLWTIVISFGDLFLSGMTVVLSNAFYGSEVSGTLSIAITIPGCLSGIVTLIVGVFYPMLTDSVAQENDEEIQKNISTTMKICGGFGLAVIAVFSAASKQFFQLWVPEENADQLFMLSCLFLAPYITTSSFWVFSNLFIAKNKVKTPALVTVGFGAMNILLFSLMGLLQAPCIAPIIVTVFLEIVLVGVFFPLYGSKITKLNLREVYFAFAKIVLAAFLVFAICFAFTHIISINGWLKFILYGIVFGFFALNFIFAFEDFALYKAALAYVASKLRLVFKNTKNRN